MFSLTNILMKSSIGSCGHLCLMFLFLWVDIVLFQAVFVSTDQEDLSSPTDIPVPQFGFTHSVSPPSLAFLSALNTLTEYSIWHLIVSTGKLYITYPPPPPPPSWVYCLGVSAVWWVVEIMQHIRSRLYEGETHQREGLVKPTECCQPKWLSCCMESQCPLIFYESAATTTRGCKPLWWNELVIFSFVEKTDFMCQSNFSNSSLSVMRTEMERQFENILCQDKICCQLTCWRVATLLHGFEEYSCLIGCLVERFAQSCLSAVFGWHPN